MAVKVFPSQNDVHGSEAVGRGITLYEDNLANWISRRQGCEDFVVSGLTGPDTHADLNYPIAAGVACIEGYDVEIDGADVAVTDNTGTYIYLQLTFDEGDHVTGAQFATNNTGVQPAHSIAIRRVEATGGQVTGGEDLRPIKEGWVLAAYGNAVLANGVTGNFDLKAASDAHRYYRVSVYSTGTPVVGYNPAIASSAYWYIIYGDGSSEINDHLVLVNNTGGTKTLKYRVYSWE